MKSLSFVGRVLVTFLAVGCGDEPASAPSAQAPSAKPAVTAPAVAASSASASAAPASDEVAAQHVLIGYKGAKHSKGVTRSKSEAKKLADEVVAKARKGDDFGELAKQYSDDDATKNGLGSVGKFKRSEMTKAFSDAAFDLKVGAISDAVETEFGFHVIKRNQ